MINLFCWWVAAQSGPRSQFGGLKVFFIATNFYSANHIHHEFQASSSLKQRIRFVNETMLFHSHLERFICGMK